MPPKRGKKAAAAAAPSLPALDSCKIALSGTFPGFSQAVIKKKIEELGGTVSTTVTADTTQLIASYADYKKPSAKVAKAQSLQIPIVGTKWLWDSDANGARPAEAAYEPKVDADDEEDDAQTAASQPLPVRTNGTAAANGAAQKRAVSPTPASAVDDSQPKPKRARGRKAVKTGDDVEVKDEEEDAPVTKPKPTKSKPESAMGEGQVAKRQDIQIPLDEGCPHASSVVHIAPDGVIFDASLNQTNASNNNNKFYRIQVCHAPHPF
jgi:poly [ADP-ribose] polymerase 2/3/4